MEAGGVDLEGDFARDHRIEEGFELVAVSGRLVRPPGAEAAPVRVFQMADNIEKAADHGVLDRREIVAVGDVAYGRGYTPVS